MKKALTLGLGVLLYSFCFGQVDENMFSASWKPGKEKVIFGNPVFRHEGLNDHGGITNLGYETFAQVMANMEKQAEREMWTKEQRDKTAEAYKELAFGGLLYLYVTRLTSEAANKDKFTVILKDSTETEFYRETLKREAPAPTNRYYLTFANVYIPKDTHGKVFVYVIDALGDENARFKFEIHLQ